MNSPGEEAFVEKRCASPGCKQVGKSKLSRCTGCMMVWYCSAECQRSHWGRHKKSCKKSVDDQAAKQASTTKLPSVDDQAAKKVSTTKLPSVCGNCGKVGSTGKSAGVLKKCNGCRQLCYCDAVCQRADWRRHKKFCKSVQRLANVVAGIPELKTTKRQRREDGCLVMNVVDDTLPDLKRMLVGRRLDGLLAMLLINVAIVKEGPNAGKANVQSHWYLGEEAVARFGPEHAECAMELCCARNGQTSPTFNFVAVMVRLDALSDHICNPGLFDDLVPYWIKKEELGMSM